MEFTKSYIGGQEVLKVYIGTELVWESTPSSLLTPIMNNFRIEEPNTTRVFFDAPSGSVDGIDYNDFTINGKTITGVDTTNNYFTLSANLSYWDFGLTIRKEGTDTTVHNFSMEPIDNQLSEPTATTIKYVDNVGGGNGDSTGSPWSVSQANAAAAGTTIYVKVGQYNDVTWNPNNNGTASNPIKFVGYKTTPGDLDDVWIKDVFDYVDTANANTYIDPAEWPLFTGTNVVGSKGIYFTEDYMIVKNIQVEHYNYDIWSISGNFISIQNCTVANAYGGSVSDNSGGGIYLGANRIFNVKVYKNVSFDNSGQNYYYRGENHLFENNSSWGGDNEGNRPVDYYLSGYDCSFNVIKDNYIERPYNLSHGGHGIGFKNKNTGCEYNLVIGNDVRGLRGEIYYAAHQDTAYNVFKENYTYGADGDSAVLVARNGAHHNLYENNKGEHCKYCIYLWANPEDQPTVSGNAAADNIFRNNMFIETSSCVTTSNSNATTYAIKDNQIYGNTFYEEKATVQGVFWSTETTGHALTYSGNTFKNNLLVNLQMPLYADFAQAGEFEITNSNFFNNQFSMPSGTGNAAINPQFNNVTDLVPTNDSLIACPQLDNYDYSGDQRFDPTTYGGEINPNEQGTPVDPNPPIVGTLALVSVTDNTINITCTATDDVGVTSWNIYLNGLPTNIIQQENLSYQITGLTANTQYSIYVTAKDQAGNESINSNTLTPTTDDVPPPTGDITYTVSNTEISDYNSLSELFADITPVSGDVIGLKGGDVFTDNTYISDLIAVEGNPITITSYGTGQATIKGSETISGWVEGSTNIWSVSTGINDVYSVVKDDVSCKLGAFPVNPNKRYSPDFYKPISDVASQTEFTCLDTRGLDNLTGATIHILTYAYTLEAGLITSHNTSTGVITISEAMPTYPIGIGATYLINNHLSLLAEQDDWFWDSAANILYMYSVDAPTGIIEATTNSGNGIEVYGSSYITIDNIEVKNFGESCIDVFGGQNQGIVVTNNTVSRAEIYLIRIGASQNTGCLVDGNTLSSTNGVAISLSSDYGEITNNTLTDIGTYNVLTSQRQYNTVGIYMIGDYGDIEYNSIINCGYLAYNMNGFRNRVWHNYSEDFTMFQHDGGAYYTFRQGDEGGAESDIQYNIAIGNELLPEWWGSNCYYQDGDTSNNIVSNNTGSGARVGITIGNDGFTIQNNNIYKVIDRCIAVFEYSTDNTNQSTVSANIVYAEGHLAKPLYIPTLVDPYTYWANYYDNKFYSADSSAVIAGTFNNVWNSFNVSEFEAYSGTGIGQTQNTNTVPSLSGSNFGTNLIVNSTFDTDVDNWGGWNASREWVADFNGHSCMKVTPTNTSGIKLETEAGLVQTIGLDYLVEFDLYAEASQRFRLEQLGVVDAEFIPVFAAPGWNTYKFAFNSVTSTTAGFILWIDDNVTTGFWIDNVYYRSADIGYNENSFLAFNKEKTFQDIALPTGTWQTLSDGSNYTGVINLQPYSSEIMIKQ